MKIIYAAFSAVLLLSTCSKGLHHQLSNPCQDFADNIPEIWKDTGKGHYAFNFASPSDYGKFVEQVNNCLPGISSQQLIELFGVPNRVEQNIYTYFMTEACLTRSRDCNVQEFQMHQDTLVHTSLIRPGRGLNVGKYWGI